jgi:formylglycine-generating enzyme required for sulfatase activity
MKKSRTHKNPCSRFGAVKKPLEPFHHPMQLTPMTPRFFLTLAIVCSLFAPPLMAKRVALVIGNATYLKAPLKNPVNDARAMAALLTRAQFTVIKRENLKTREIGDMLREFRSRIQPGDEVVVFYAGHGLMVKGENYLPTVDADIRSEDDVPQYSINVSKQLLVALDESKAGIKLLFLDACRNNPYARSFRSESGDLGHIKNAPSGTLIHYATRPGSVAADGEGQNGLYTEHLLKYLAQPGQIIELALKEVAASVESASKGEQEPWSEGSLKGGHFYVFAPVQIKVAAPISRDSDAEFWTDAKRVDSLSGYQAYVAAFPKGQYLGLANAMIEKLTSKITAVSVSANLNMAEQLALRLGMVTLPRGKIRVGGAADDEKPMHEVIVDYPLTMGATEVTVGQWREYVKSTPSINSAWANPGFSQTDDHPVVNVSFNDVQGYLAWLNAQSGFDATHRHRWRLPTEAEWEYAARAGTSTEFHTGDKIEPSQAHFAWQIEFNGSKKLTTSPTGTARVKSYPANAWGLHDMHGNAWEWVEDCYESKAYEQRTKVSNPWPANRITVNEPANCRRVLRGGSWNYVPNDLRSASRFNYVPTSRVSFVGFRVARTAP